MKQNKGKDLQKIAPSKLVDKEYYYSTKYDGFYVQIKYNGDREIEFYTSGGKPFYLEGMANYIISHFYGKPFYIECEYTYDCVGYLGDRGKSARLTTYRTEFAKGIYSKGNPMKDNFYVLDILDSGLPFKYRLAMIGRMFNNHDWLTPVDQILFKDLDLCKLAALRDVEQGFEGGMLKDPRHIYQPGKRTNDIIKLKPRLTADLECIGINEGTGKYEGLIGSLQLIDSEGREVAVGSGLNDRQRSMPHNHFIGNVIEIEYESIKDTYLQPVVKFVRLDKDIKDID